MLVGGPYNEFVDFEAPVLFETQTAKKSWVMIPLSAYVRCHPPQARRDPYRTG
jgi:hypothetical protein